MINNSAQHEHYTLIPFQTEYGKQIYKAYYTFFKNNFECWNNHQTVRVEGYIGNASPICPLCKAVMTIVA